jgi:2,5-diamino-6-(ribosylamino)-4(3H)-pyrimidinone 5'-phosphate reductase
MRPFTFINAAMSADGKLSTYLRKQIRISGNTDFQRVDRLRAGVDAVMVGIGTILADNPSLTIKSKDLQRQRKEQGKLENPIRIVVDSTARIPIDADIFKKGDGIRIIAVSESAPVRQVEELKKKNRTRIISTGKDKVDLIALMSSLKDMGINSIMVEGGANLNWSLISGGLVDEIYIYTGPLVLGGEKAPTLIDGSGFSSRNEAPELELISVEKMDDGALLKWRIL